MAKTYAELAAYFANGISDKMNQTKERVISPMTTKIEVVATTIESKLLIRDRMLGNINDAEFAYQLAQDDNVRKTVNQLCQQIMQPTPVSAVPTDHSNSFINLGAGISAFWTEMQKSLPIEIENVTEIESILRYVDAGLDKDLEPDIRKLFLKEAGMTSEMLDELVPLSDYVEYENRAKDNIRKKIMEELGFEPGEELSEENQLLVDSMTEDRIMGIKMQIDVSDTYELTFEDIYGISAQDMYELFEEFDGVPAQTETADWPTLVENGNALSNYQAVLDNTITGNLALLEQLERQEKLTLTADDLNFVAALDQTTNEEPMTLKDAVAKAMEQNHPVPDHVPMPDITAKEEPMDLKDAVAIAMEQNHPVPDHVPMPDITEEDLAFTQAETMEQGITEQDLLFAQTYVEEDFL